VSVDFAAPAFTLRGNNTTATVTVVTREQVDSVSVHVNDDDKTVLSEEDFSRISTSNNRFVYQAEYIAPTSGTYEFELTALNTKTGQSYIAEKSGALSKFEWKFTDAQGTKNVTLTDGGAVAADKQSSVDDSIAAEPDAPAIGESNQARRGLTVDDVKEAALSSEDERLTLYQAYKLLYYIEREIIGYGLIDPIKNDQQIEDISCNGYNEPVFVYHTDHKQIRSNLVHGQEELDRFVKSLAQYAGKEVSRRSPQADAKIPDGSRAQLTLGDEVSEGGTNYTIRQFKDVPFTPVDLLNWETYSLDELAYLWLCAEHGMSILVAGGTGAGKTTTLNAISLFIPAQSKLVSIEDTQEIKLPHRNWTKELTREAGDQMDRRTSIDEYDLLESALRMRPDRIIMSEVRGEEGEELFQGMSSGHPGLTTFHADSVDKAIYRMTSEPISVEPAMFVSLDLVCVQTETQVAGNSVRRSTEVAEIGGIEDDGETIERNQYFRRNAKTDTIVSQGDSWNLHQIQDMSGWSDERLAQELDRRKAVLAYLSVNQITQYREVASTIQAFIQDQETVLEAMRTHTLTDRIEGFRSLGNIQIEAGEEAEKSVSRPSPSADLQHELEQTLESDLVRVFADVN
jgi:flagellar protein FlaI